MPQPADPAPRRRRWRPGPDTAIALAALVLAAGGGGYALGAAVDGSTITACVDGGGVPQKIAANGDCSVPPGQPTLTTLSWNQAGPQGLVGPQGPVGPAGKDASVEPTVISLPVEKKRAQRGLFRVRLQLPGPGTYLLEGHVDWTRLALNADAPVTCRIDRTTPSTLLDSLALSISRNGPYGGEIDENGTTTVTVPAPSSGPVQQLPKPVVVQFTCTAYASPTAKARNARVTFRDWTFTATPVKVSVIKKP